MFAFKTLLIFYKKEPAGYAGSFDVFYYYLQAIACCFVFNLYFSDT